MVGITFTSQTQSVVPINREGQPLRKAMIWLDGRSANIIRKKLYYSVSELNIIGGGAQSNIWCQILADIMHRKINRVADPQKAGARGAALLASVALGYIDSFDEIKKYIKIDQCFSPNFKNKELYNRLFREFKNLYRQNKK